MELLILVLGIPIVAIGVRLGIGPLLPDKQIVREEYLVDRLGKYGLLSAEEIDLISTQYPRRKWEQAESARLREKLEDLKELGFLTDVQLEQKLLLLNQHYKH